jgi:CubicO group peptidase (beta-lactamase class C family)
VFEFNPDILTAIKNVCKGKKHIKLTVGYILNDKITVRVFNEDGETQDENYIYEIASITKTFTASLLAKNIYDNKMSLDDSIQKYFDGLADDRYYPTLRRLATHTAGYSAALPFTWREYLSSPLKGFPSNPNVDKVKAVLLKNQRKDKDYPWQYANFDFMLIGHAVGIASGKDYWGAMDDFLSVELGLQNTYTGTNPAKNLHGFNKKNRDCGNIEYDKSPMIVSGEGDISSTAEDLLKYAKINMYEEKPYISICHNKHTNVSSLYATVLGRMAGVKGIDMGLGWMVNKENNQVIWHSGDADSFSSYLAIDKEKKLASIVLANYRMDTIKIGSSVLDTLQKS